MFFLLDHLSAQIIVGGMLLMLVTVHVRGQRAVQEVNQVYALRRQQIAFTDVLRRDLRNATQVMSLNEDAGTRTFSFRALTAPGTGADRLVTYRREWVARVDGVDRYRIDRYVDGVRDGSSMATVTGWEISARNAQGMSVLSAGDARQFVVRLEAANPYRSHDASDPYRQAGISARTQWDGAFHPPRIQQIENL